MALTKDLTGPALDWAVAKAQQLVEGGPYDDFCIRRGKLYLWCNGALRDEVYSPTINWLFGGPLIEGEGIHLYVDESKLEWVSSCWGHQSAYHGTTPLIAAMRCFVASKLGDEVEIPEELL